MHRPAVLVQNARLCKRLATMLTDMWPACHVDGHVHLQGTLAGKGAVALIAVVWTISGVLLSMFLQSLVGGKPCTAVVTAKWLVTAVCPQVLQNSNTSYTSHHSKLFSVHIHSHLPKG